MDEQDGEVGKSGEGLGGQPCSPQRIGRDRSLLRSDRQTLRSDRRPLLSLPATVPMSGSWDPRPEDRRWRGLPVPVVRAGFGIGASMTVVAETDCLTVVVTWLTSGTTAPVMPGTTGITDAVRCIGAPVTDETGTALASDDVELTSDDVERPGGGTGPAGSWAGTIDVTGAGIGEEGPVAGAALAGPATAVVTATAKNMPAKSAR